MHNWIQVASPPRPYLLYVITYITLPNTLRFRSDKTNWGRRGGHTITQHWRALQRVLQILYLYQSGLGENFMRDRSNGRGLCQNECFLNAFIMHFSSHYNNIMIKSYCFFDNIVEVIHTIWLVRHISKCSRNLERDSRCQWVLGKMRIVTVFIRAF